MEQVWRKLERIANLMLILGCVVVGGFFLHNRMATPKNPAKQVIGQKLDIHLLGDMQSNRILLLSLSTKCTYCAQSIPFYQRLTSGPHRATIVAAFPQSESEGRKFLDEHNVVVNKVLSTPQFLAFLPATPTLILIDRHGTVIDAWMGRLSTDEEDQVLRELSL